MPLHHVPSATISDSGIISVLGNVSSTRWRSGWKPSITISGDQEIALPNFCKLKKTHTSTRIHLVNGFSRSPKVPWKSDIFDKKYYKGHSCQLRNDSATDLVMPLEFIVNSRKVCLGILWNSTPGGSQTDHQANIKYSVYFNSVTLCSLPTDNME